MGTEDLVFCSKGAQRATHTMSLFLLYISQQLIQILLDIKTTEEFFL